MRLRAWKVGGRWQTSSDALADFMSALNAHTTPAEVGTVATA
ncbi:MAG TPA: hypothetical protein VM533_08385 [Fimbriiglobus sp.]|nr:hypothetical protein [Fimbriiglobus sp.]